MGIALFVPKIIISFRMNVLSMVCQAVVGNTSLIGVTFSHQTQFALKHFSQLLIALKGSEQNQVIALDCMGTTVAAVDGRDTLSAFTKGKLAFCKFPGHVEADTFHADMIRLTAIPFVEDIGAADTVLAAVVGESSDVLSADADGGEVGLVPTM